MKQHNILIVDDDPHVLDALEGSLKSEYNIFPAKSGQDALSIMEMENISLVISDQKMSGMTGVELMEELARRYPDAVRIIITGYAEDNLYMDAINVGHIYGFINKPWRLEELRSIVRNGVRHYEKTQALREPHIRTLLQSGILTAEQLDAVLEKNEDSGKSACEILVENGIILPKELNMAMEVGEAEKKDPEEVLLERGIIFESDLEMANEQQKREKKSLTKILIDMEYADEETILVAYALHLGMPYIPIKQFPKRKHLAKILPSKLAYKYTILPLDSAVQTLIVASPEPLSEDDKLNIEKETGRRVMVTLAKHRDIEEGIGEYYADELPLESRSSKESSANEEAAINA